jgi:hypothetical protein
MDKRYGPLSCGLIAWPLPVNLARASCRNGVTPAPAGPRLGRPVTMAFITVPGAIPVSVVPLPPALPAAFITVPGVVGLGRPSPHGSTGDLHHGPGRDACLGRQKSPVAAVFITVPGVSELQSYAIRCADRRSRATVGSRFRMGRRSPSSVAQYGADLYEIPILLEFDLSRRLMRQASLWRCAGFRTRS